MLFRSEVGHFLADVQNKREKVTHSLEFITRTLPLVVSLLAVVEVTAQQGYSLLSLMRDTSFKNSPDNIFLPLNVALQIP